MDDKGEKIIFLARELLESGMEFPPAPAKKTTTITMTFKALCFTSLLAAGGSALVTNALREDVRPLNRYEKTEIKALIFYTTKTKGIDETALRQDIAAKWGTQNIDELTSADFPALRRFLQEKAQ
jgi:hypothetical protein